MFLWSIYQTVWLQWGFFIQEPKSEKDESLCRKVNEFLNNPPTPGSGGGRASAGKETPSTRVGQGRHRRRNAADNIIAGERDLQSILNSMSQQQLMQLFGSVSGMPGLSSLLVPSEKWGNSSTLCKQGTNNAH